MSLLQTTSAAGGYEELSDEEVSFDGDFDPQEVGMHTHIRTHSGSILTRQQV